MEAVKYVKPIAQMQRQSLLCSLWVLRVGPAARAEITATLAFLGVTVGGAWLSFGNRGGAALCATIFVTLVSLIGAWTADWSK
ncbi:hypothetical protein QBC46DRAFT_377136 [Diplogelasinospora grovesii]|uniref:Uncharacterized protein n=1 Tax=Diplogelasinospora grovesii TaxID=303347 RepID=A0AAN6S705_9PEZI|nr:hypothetical protein QBC46DRAFT_377136 [Diplogelasinospora grovesii]